MSLFKNIYIYNTYIFLIKALSVTYTFLDAAHLYKREKMLYLNYNLLRKLANRHGNLKTALCGAEDSASFSDL
jgi:hypothetical protein